MKKIILIILIVIPNLLFAQLVNDLRVNTDTALSIPKYNAKVSSNKNGNTVVVWDETGNSKANVYAQIFNGNFNRIGTNFVVNTLPNLSEGSSVVVRKDGSFGIAWMDGSLVPYRGRVFFRIFNNFGTPISNAIIINDTLRSYNPRINIGCDEQQRFIVAFDNALNSVNYPDIFYQIVDSNGVKIGNNVKVNQYSSYGKPAIGVKRDGGFVIAWEGSGVIPYHQDIYCQLYSPNGTPIGSNQQVNDIETDTLDFQFAPDIAVDSTGKYVIAFGEIPYSSGVNRVKYQRYNSNGGKINTNKIINASAYNSYVSSDEEGNLIFLLSVDNGYGYLYNLRIDKNDNLIGSYFLASNQLPNIGKGGTDVFMVNKKFINVWVDMRLSNQPQIFLNVRSYTNPDSTVFVNNISSEIPLTYSLGQNYPNPFNPTTTIKFSIPNGFPIKTLGNDKVELKVYDVMGREVATLVNESLKPGTYEVTFDGSNINSGVYFYKLMTNGFTVSKKMLMTK